MKTEQGRPKEALPSPSCTRVKLLNSQDEKQNLKAPKEKRSILQKETIAWLMEDFSEEALKAKGTWSRDCNVLRKNESCQIQIHPPANGS